MKKQLQQASKKQLLQQPKSTDKLPLLDQQQQGSTQPPSPPAGFSWFGMLMRVSLWLWIHLIGCFIVAYFENTTFPECSAPCSQPESSPTPCPGVTGSRCWTVIDTVYFWVMSVTLATYGDVSANSPVGKWIVLGLSAVALIALARVVEAVQEEKAERVDTSLATRLAELRAIITSPADRNADGEISRDEFALYYCAKHRLVPSKETCATADAEFDSLDLFKDGKLDLKDLDILQRAVTLEEHIAEAKSALGGGSTGLTKEEFVRKYCATAKGGVTEQQARDKFNELDGNGSGVLSAADLEKMSQDKDALIDPALQYNESYAKAKGDASLSHPLVKVITEESSRDNVTGQEFLHAVLLLVLYFGLCYLVFHSWSVELPITTELPFTTIQGPGSETDYVTTVALATSLLATLPTMIGGLPSHSQTMRAVLIPLTGLAFFFVGQKTVIVCIRYVEQWTWDTLKRQHQRFLYEAAKASATAKQWSDAPRSEQLPKIEEVKERFDDVKQRFDKHFEALGYDSAQMAALEQAVDEEAEAAIFGQGRSDDDGLARMQQLAQAGGMRR